MESNNVAPVVADQAGEDAEIARQEKENDDGIEAVRVDTSQTITPDMRKQVLDYYSGDTHNAQDHTLSQCDITPIVDRVISMHDDEAVDILLEAISFHKVRTSSCQLLLSFSPAVTYYML